MPKKLHQISVVKTSIQQGMIDSHAPTTAKLMSDLNPPPKAMNVIVRAACRHMAFNGVRNFLLWRPNSLGR